MVFVGLTDRAEMRQAVDDDGVVLREFDLYFPRCRDVTLSRSAPKTDIGFWKKAIENAQRTGYALIANSENPIRTPSAGAIVLYSHKGDITHAAFLVKSADAQNDPNSLVVFNGYPESVQEWTNLYELVAREGMEEGGMHMTKSDRQLLMPLSNEPPYRLEERLFELSDSLIRDVFVDDAMGRLHVSGYVDGAMEFRHGLFRDTLNVYVDDVLAGSFVGAISWNPITGFNFIQPFVVPYTGDHPADDYWVITGESKQDGTPLILTEEGSRMAFLDLRELQGKHFGDVVTQRIQRVRKVGDTESGKPLVELSDGEIVDKWITDHVPRSALHQVIINGEPVYPDDTMEDARVLLSIPAVLKCYERGFRFSDMETFLSTGARPSELLLPTVQNRYLRRHQGAQ